MVLKVGNYIDRSGRYHKYYRCENYPTCRGTHRAHPDGSPVGTPATEAVRKRRHELHNLANQIWSYEVKTERREMYEWLKKNTRSGHIGKMGEEELNDLEEKLKRIIEFGDWINS